MGCLTNMKQSEGMLGLLTTMSAKRPLREASMFRDESMNGG